MALSTYLASNIAAWMDQTKTAFPTPPTEVYLALHTVEPAPDAGDNELVGGGYARRIITLATTVAHPASVQCTNAAPVIFPVATADLGDVPNWSIWDQPAGGNMLGFGAFDAAPQWVNGAALVVPLNQLTIDLLTDIVTVTP